MHQINRDIAKSFLKKEILNRGYVWTNGKEIRYRGYRIVWREDNKIFFNMQGWATPTTRRYINAVLDEIGSKYKLVQRDFNQYLVSGGERIEINPSNNYMIAYYGMI